MRAKIWPGLRGDAQSRAATTRPPVIVTGSNKIDSLFFYGCLFSPAVAYNALIQGIQKTTVSNGGTYS